MKRPPEYGEVLIDLNIPPVSQQARGEVKQAFQEAIRQRLIPFQFLLTGEVSISVEWSVNEWDRYETDRSPDVDNILKPLMDALTGPRGIIIDDNQVQRVSCHWVHTASKGERLAITIGYHPGEWLNKAGLYFVQLEGALCVPISSDMPEEFKVVVIERYQDALRMRREAVERGIDYETASVIMPIQRMFHRTRLRDFRVLNLDEFNQLYVNAREA